jgi:hypothetical protein
MKIQIDTENFEIKLDEDTVLLSELITVLDNLFPNGEWKDYKLRQEKIINWTNPIIINEPLKVEPYQPWQTQPWYITGSNTSIYNTPDTLTTHNFDIQMSTNNLSIE